jgi:phosphate:Na+ symporter
MIARALEAVCGLVEAAVAAASRGEPVHPVKNAISVSEVAAALRQAQVFLSDVNGPPGSDDEQRRLTSTLHALDHASRLAETANGKIDFWTLRSSPDDARAGELCAEAMRSATSVAGEVEAPAALAVSTEALVRLEHSATQLEEMQRSYRSTTLGAVADGILSADAAILRVETVRSLQALAYHAWRSAAHLVGRGG